MLWLLVSSIRSACRGGAGWGVCLFSFLRSASPATDWSREIENENLHSVIRACSADLTNLKLVSGWGGVRVSERGL